MSNRILLSTGSLFHLPLATIFSIARNSGFDGLELIFNEYPETINPQVVQKAIDGFSLPVISAHVPMDSCSVFGAVAEKIIIKCIETGSQIGVEKLVIHPWRKNTPGYSNQLFGSIDDLRARSTQDLLIENLPKQVNDYEVAEKYYNPIMLRKSSQSICLDTSHLATTKLDFKHHVGAILPAINHVHLSDSNLQRMNEVALLDEHLLVGAGKLPLQWFIHQLSSIHYKGDYTIEVRPSAFGQKSEEAIIDVLSDVVDRVKSMLISSMRAG